MSGIIERGRREMMGNMRERKMNGRREREREGWGKNGKK